MRREYGWALITLIIAVALAFILLSMVKDDSRSENYAPLPASAYDRKLNRLDRNGVEAAYRAQVSLLFQNLMNAPQGDKTAPHRMLTGHRKARAIYIDTMTELDARDPQSADAP